MINRNMKRKPYKRAVFWDYAWLIVVLVVFGWLFINDLLNYLGD